ncbi:ficolin-1-A-like [Physella acuta]|uniref:ficolin-1-A-like n=1 Tax=Physella acuta TaxID=109671 RepID=UPI0027DE9D6A|nr:ficolin-1-A-like [Physella acuta]
MDINIWLGIIVLLTLQTHFVFSDDAPVLHGKNSIRTVGGVNFSAEVIARREVKITDNFQTYQKTCDRNSMSDDLPERAIMKSEIGVDVMCDTKTDGGGWIVLQRRNKLDVDFRRNWEDYRDGFGTYAGDYWLGLKHMYKLTSMGRWELRVEMTFRKVDYYAQYKSFKIGSESEYFPLRISGFSGNVSDDLKYHNDASFATPDYPDEMGCAAKFRTGWWFQNCLTVNLNGEHPMTQYQSGIHWKSVGGFKTLDRAEMKMRKKPRISPGISSN